MKTSHVPMLRLLLCILFVFGLVAARPPPDMGPEIRTPPSGSCGAAIANDDSPQVQAIRPPCRRPRLRNQDLGHTTLP
ncbi:hypothetical protein AALP_AA6G345700 [Arabis alpina]|uniref:Uncharacterized protein n=1 Tax=Arabis alpina TaxID=50452 RepID=A0A087GTL5_ARAAL|nr:hypothetical protein AALP_AA6G345700 [Arabis alpina]